jgi:hypothetical protein
MRRYLAAFCLLVTLLTLGDRPASANIIFNLTNVQFSDGGVATGSFITNDARTSLIDFNITTTGALAFNYTSATASSSSTALPFILVLNTPPTLDHIFELTFTNLTPTGSLITLGQFDSFEQTLTGRRTVTGGSVTVATTAVPEPSSLALASLGTLALFGHLLRRRRGRA